MRLAFLFFLLRIASSEKWEYGDRHRFPAQQTGPSSC
jgi:hypothetical protein